MNEIYTTPLLLKINKYVKIFFFGSLKYCIIEHSQNIIPILTLLYQRKDSENSSLGKSLCKVCKYEVIFL